MDWSSSHILYLLASTDWRLVRFALLSREYWREYHPAIVKQYYRSVRVEGDKWVYPVSPNPRFHIQYWGYETGSRFVLHRENGPAVIWDDVPVMIPILRIQTYDWETEKNCQIWFRNGIVHRANGPAVHSINIYGREKWEWFVDGLLHRKSGPAYIVADIKPRIDDGPTYRGKYIAYRIWYWRGEIHRQEKGRNGGPALTKVVCSRKIKYAYYHHGDRHRLSGPATFKRREGEKEIIDCLDWLFGRVTTEITM